MDDETRESVVAGLSRQKLMINDHPESMAVKKRLFKALPFDTARINVVDEDWTLKWRLLEQVRDTDFLIYRQDGVVNHRSFAKGETFSLDNYVPVSNRDDYLRLMTRASEKSRNPLYRAVASRPDSPEAFHQVMLAMTDLATDLAYDRRLMQRKGTADPEFILKMRTQERHALNSIRDSVLKRFDQQLKAAEIDMDSPSFRNVFVMIVTTIQQAMEAAGIEPKLIQLAMNGFSSSVDTPEWQDAVRRASRGQSISGDY